MKAVILNSGIGSRMGAETARQPKCLVELLGADAGRVDGGTTILGAQLSLLRDFGIEQFVITTGYCDTAVRAHVLARFPNLSVEYVFNPRYRETNYIYSLHLAREQIQGDVLLLHGDMVLEPAALQRLFSEPAKNAVLINRGIEPPEKDFKGRVTATRIREIGVNLEGAGCCALYPVYKLSGDFYAAWAAEMASFVERGETGGYAENALNRVLTKAAAPTGSIFELAPTDFRGLCMEVDTLRDLKRARVLYRASVSRGPRSLPSGRVGVASDLIPRVGGAGPV